jgi:hypothetical protein
MEMVREALRNIRAFPTRALLLASVAALSGAGIVVATVVEVDSVRDSLRSLNDAGANVLVVRPDSGDITTSQCEALNNVSVVSAAGGMLSATERVATSDPSSKYGVVTVTPGFLRLAWPAGQIPPGTTVVGGHAVSKRLGLSAGSTIVLRGSDSSQTLVIGAPAHIPSRMESLDRSITIATVIQAKLGECLVEAQPGAKAAVSEVLADWFLPTRVVVSDYLRSNSLTRDPQTDFVGRATQWLPLLAGGAMTLLFALTWWSRRAEVGIYRALGMRRPHLLVQTSTEGVVLLLLPIMIGASLAIGFEAEACTGLVAASALRDLLKVVALSSVAPVVAAAVLSSSTSLDLLRGR